MSTFRFTHTRFEGPSEHVPAMGRIKEMIAEQDFSDNVFAMTMEYANWETDAVMRGNFCRQTHFY